jgi:hypothetical protein
MEQKMIHGMRRRAEHLYETFVEACGPN